MKRVRSNNYDDALVEALETYAAAQQRNPSISTVHPVDDFMSMMPLFNAWRVHERKDVRPISKLATSDARLTFLQFSIDYNDHRLPLEYYRSVGDVIRSKQAVSLISAAVDEATHMSVWHDIVPMKPRTQT